MPCTDLPALVAKVGRNGQYAQSSLEQQRGVTARSGDEVYLLVYIHNGADENGALSETVAKNVKLITSVDIGTKPAHEVSIVLRGDNTNVVLSQITIHTPPLGRLVLVPAGGEQFDHSAEPVAQGFDVGNNTITFGDLEPGYDESFFVRFKVRVVVGGKLSDAPSSSQDSSVAVSFPDQQLSSPSRTRRRESFNKVWGLVNGSYYDPNFGGVDWQKVRERYAPRVEQAHDDETFFGLLQQMLNELHSSHLVILPPYALPSNDAGDTPSTAGTEETPKEAANGDIDEVTAHLTYGIGVELRLIGESLVITRVDADSSGARAGLKPGFIIKNIDGQSFDEIIKELSAHEEWYRVMLPQLPMEILVGYLNGIPGTSVRLNYLDGLDRPHEITISREKLKGILSPAVGNLPAQYAEFEAKRLPDGIGYIRFTAFTVPMMEKFCTALRSMSDAPALIIDLRGNIGGLVPIIYGIGGLLESKPAEFGALTMRGGTFDLSITPNKRNYTGHVILLTDTMSMSASEMLASGLQETGRAVVVGERSSGAGAMAVMADISGARLMYPIGLFRTAKGATLEGKGLVPDFEVKLDRRALLEGRDPQLEAAIEQAQSPIRSAEAKTIPLRSTAPAPVAPVSDQEQEARQTNDVVGSAITPSKSPADSHPTAGEILEKYVQAVGGRAAFEKLTSRVSKGTVQEISMGLTGTVEIYEKAPEKSLMTINVKGLGALQDGFDGRRGWLSHPLAGFFETTSGEELAQAKRDADFYANIRLKELYPKMTFLGKTQEEGVELYEIRGEAADGATIDLYFDVRTGLLMRKDDTSFTDYREVDGVKLPFLITLSSNGFNFIITLNEIKHNVTIDDAKFVEIPTCFNR